MEKVWVTPHKLVQTNPLNRSQNAKLMICKNTLTQNGIFQAICQAKHPLPFQRYFISLIGQTEIFNISTRTRAELYYPAFAFSGLPALSALNGEVFVFVRNGGNGRDTDAPIINAIFSAQEDYEQGMTLLLS